MRNIGSKIFTVLVGVLAAGIGVVLIFSAVRNADATLIANGYTAGQYGVLFDSGPTQFAFDFCGVPFVAAAILFVILRWGLPALVRAVVRILRDPVVLRELFTALAELNPDSADRPVSQWEPPAFEEEGDLELPPFLRRGQDQDEED